MPDKNEHMSQALRNDQTVDYLMGDAGASPEWAVTVMFYGALHLLEAYLSTTGVRHVSGEQVTHEERISHMRRDPFLATELNSYRQLRVDSENARYDCRRFTRIEINHIHRTLYSPLATHLSSGL